MLGAFSSGTNTPFEKSSYVHNGGHGVICCCGSEASSLEGRVCGEADCNNEHGSRGGKDELEILFETDGVDKESN